MRVVAVDRLSARARDKFKRPNDSGGDFERDRAPLSIVQLARSMSMSEKRRFSY